MKAESIETLGALSNKTTVTGAVPTGGFGSTRAEYGPMRAGERIDPVRGLILLQRDASEAERIVRRCAANVVLAFKEALQ